MQYSLKIILACFLFTSCSVQKSFKNDLSLNKEFLNNELDNAIKQVKYLGASIGEKDIPTSFSNNKHINWGTGWWCSGFYPGTVLYLYEYSNDSTLLSEAKQKLQYLEKEKDNKTTHDLGFMLYCSFGNALRLTKDSTAYLEILKTGAESLASRFSERTGTIKSWDVGKDWDGRSWVYPVIIDNLMNLEFLTEISRITGNHKLMDIAKSHANKTLKNHFRADASSYHVIDYDPNTGEVIAKKTAQGAFDESSWSRGQSWALYGFTMMYRETKDKAYLNLARNIAKFYLNHPNLPEDLIPYWDMDVDKLPRDSKYNKQKEFRDVSTASVMASALIELSQYTGGKESELYLQKAETMIRSLSSAPYKAEYKEAGGFILKHSVGSIPHNAEIDVPLTYADYYYVEALIRYLRLLDNKPVV